VWFSNTHRLAAAGGVRKHTSAADRRLSLWHGTMPMCACQQQVLCQNTIRLGPETHLCNRQTSLRQTDTPLLQSCHHPLRHRPHPLRCHRCLPSSSSSSERASCAPPSSWPKLWPSCVSSPSAHACSDHRHHPGPRAHRPRGGPSLPNKLRLCHVERAFCVGFCSEDLPAKHSRTCFPAKFGAPCFRPAG
jgi:hypothetical protein